MALTDSDLSHWLGDKEEEATGEIRRVAWDEHRKWLDQNLFPGMHVSVIAPTGGGKTHLIRHGILPLFQRFPVLILQFKKRDPTWAGLGRRVKHFPSGWDRARYANRRFDDERWMTDPEWFRLQLREYRWQDNGRENASYREARRVAGQALDRAYREGNWVVVVDDVRGISDSKEPHLGLEAPLTHTWEHGRTAPVTLIAGVQQPANAPTSLYDQPSVVYLGKMLDVGRHERLAEIGGDTKTIKAVLPTLRRHEFLAVDRESGEMAITAAPQKNVIMSRQWQGSRSGSSSTWPPR